MLYTKISSIGTISLALACISFIFPTHKIKVGSLLGIFLQSFFVQFTMTALNIVVFVIVYGRMIEIYLMTSLAPIPFATIANREAGHMGRLLKYCCKICC